jgi:small subunit ribosomal protein S20
MAHHKSAIRQERRSIRRSAVNKQNKSGLRSQVKKVREALEDKNQEEAIKLLPKTFSTIDKTVKKGTIHANKAARTKSRLSRQAANLTPKPAK